VFSVSRSGQRIEVFEEPTGWQKVDRQLQEVRMRLDSAETEEQFQAVGLLCREVLISVAQVWRRRLGGAPITIQDERGEISLPAP
jgi:hypothetical protein